MKQLHHPIWLEAWYGAFETGFALIQLSPMPRRRQICARAADPPRAKQSSVLSNPHGSILPITALPIGLRCPARCGAAQSCVARLGSLRCARLPTSGSSALRKEKNPAISDGKPHPLALLGRFGSILGALNGNLIVVDVIFDVYRASIKRMQCREFLACLQALSRCNLSDGLRR